MIYEVKPSGHRYPVMIKAGLLGEVGEIIGSSDSPPDGVAVITDSNVWGIYGGKFTEAMSGINFTPIVLEPGEGAKSLAGLGQLYDAFAEMRLKRDGLVMTFGGGVVGDLGGFAAATWMRGVSYIQIPSTLLAQVDSSIGGKTAVNTDKGKNLAGVFYQPDMVLSDVSLLESLPPREFRCGMAEVIKYGAIRSKGLFDSIGSGSGIDALTRITFECCRIKGEIVERDEFDVGERMLLNFGHSFGHAIEKLGGYSRYNHGEAVAAGMVLAAETGEKLGLTETGAAQELREVLAVHGLAADSAYSSKEILPQMALDKKTKGDGVQLILLRRIGEAFIHNITFKELEQQLY
ncbi:MAG: 3-dehydroquinate synthase [Clostridiales Family XIII bacterium]|jgi:3-dehydroquinate synthase|nr:3-dehydroquinate synthase [Clostridiales Family XIII bacterium]